MATILLKAGETAESEFPPVCARCGAWGEFTTRKLLQWTPAGIVLLPGLVGLIFAAHYRTGVVLNLPFCQQHRNHWAERMRRYWICLFAGIILLGAIQIVLEFDIGIPNLGDVLAFAFGFGVLGCLATALYSSMTAIRVTGYADRRVQLSGVADSFAAAVVDFRIVKDKRRALERQAEDDAAGWEEPNPFRFD